MDHGEADKQTPVKEGTVEAQGPERNHFGCCYGKKVSVDISDCISLQ